MRQATLKTLLLIISFIGALTASNLATAGGRGTPGPQPPLIMKTIMDTKENVLIISGRHFGLTPPTVVLAGQVLDVQRSSEHEVVASLPPGLAAATYGLTVTTNGRNRASSNLFSATLFGAGNK